ncbi:hypothetical protein LOTGIDRAFT_153082 [Lottia gigantea]|uniref:Uncharacterized protein n=1 Tax=Lottia gigantea TaxID=225164 RepID=V4ALI1_LOTGI|nr:hypothetical protein LOTGIDRAFT_153082 [Lottia gigantea]ESO97972.1 hypothetical protein LOTGIDRAFT_153082 [Lottia gigantea]
MQNACDYANAIYPCLSNVQPSCDPTEFEAVLATEDAARDRTIIEAPDNCGLPLPVTTPAPSCFDLLNSCVQFKDTGSTDPCQAATNIESCLNELTSQCSEADLQVVGNNQGPYITQLIQQDPSGQQCLCCFYDYYHVSDPFCMNVYNQCYDAYTTGVTDPCQQAGVIEPCLGTILQERLCPYDVIGNVYNSQIVVKDQLVAQDPNGCQITTTQTTTTAELTTTTTEPTSTTAEPTTTTAEPTTTTAEPTTTTLEPTTSTLEPTTTTAEPTTTTLEPTTTTAEPTTTTLEPTTTTAEPTTSTLEPTTRTLEPTTPSTDPTTTTATTEPTTTTAEPTTPTLEPTASTVEPTTTTAETTTTTTEPTTPSTDPTTTTAEHTTTTLELKTITAESTTTNAEPTTTTTEPSTATAKPTTTTAESTTTPTESTTTELTSTSTEITTTIITQLASTTTQSTTPELPSGIENCAAGSLTCIYKFQQDEYLANGSIPLICLAVDETISCIKNRSSGCDPVAAADVIQSMNSVIEQYTVLPYSCTLENEVEELDGCPGELANCTELLNQAKQQSDASESCRLNDDYKNCMTDRTPSCDADIKVTIDKNVQDAETFFQDRNYFCDERLVNNLTVCDTSYNICNIKLQPIGNTVFSSTDVCRIADDFNTCVDEMAGNCTTQIKNFYLTTRDNIVSSFDQKPYFCADVNACLTLFNDCNDTLSQNANTDCELMNMYDICLTSISPLCDAQKFVNLTDVIEQIQSETRSQDPHLCTTQAPTTLTTSSSILSTTVKSTTDATTTKVSTSTTGEPTTTELPSGVENCAAGSLPCIYKFQEDEYLANGSVPLICSAVDETISCIKNKSSGCDPVAAADVIQSMNSVIEQYTVPPYSCTLENQLEELDGCPGELANCTEMLNEAKQQTDPNEACRINNDYKNCMTDRTPSCDADIQVTIDKNIQDAETFFQDRNYFCDERLVNNLTDCDTGFQNCNQKLNVIGRTRFTSSEVCPIADDFNICVDEMVGNCTTNIKNFYLTTRDNIVSSFDQKPYFCADENACLTLFNDCNNTLSPNTNTDCERMKTYDICLKSISPLCEAQQFDNLTAAIIKIQNDTRDPYYCTTTVAPSTETTMPSTYIMTSEKITSTSSTTNGQSPSTTTELPSGVENCAAGSLPCIYKFQEDEYLANGSVPLICSAVDETINCIKNRSSGCDPVAAADVIQSMNSVIEQYTVPPYSCTLENKVEELDGCPGELANCTEFLNQAKQTTGPSEACRLNDDYKSCMTNNTPSCDITIQDTINRNIEDADQYFTDRNYFCDERLVNNLTICDESYKECNSRLQPVGRDALTSTDVCPIADDFQVCIDEISGNCTTKIRAFYTETATNIRASFNRRPYFCDDDDACNKLFADCNDTLSGNEEDDCGLIPIYRTCLSSISDICDVEQFSNLTTRINQIENDTIEEDPNQCKPTTTIPPTTTTGVSTTTTAPYTTTERPTGLAYCAGESMFCINQFNQDEVQANGTVSLICQAVDRALLCIANKTSTCDPISAASVANSMSGIIEGYQGPPNNCSLENSENPAFQLDGCTKALADCDEVLTKAKAQFDANDGCRINEGYKNCMIENTTDCDVSFVDSINQNIQQADLYFIQRNYFCQERIANNLTECDASFRNCNSIIQDIGRTVTKSQQVCMLVEQFDLCRTNMTDSCTTKIGEFYYKNAETSSERFTGVPFFCGLENGCEKLFDDCNETLGSSSLEPCGLLPIYRTCLSSISDICDVEQFSNLTTRINQIENDTIEQNPNNCIPTTTAIPSTATPSTTTERPTGLAYCAGESMFCINQFNQDEFLANRTVALICQAVDRALSCVANKTSTCDPISAASVANSMSGIIEGYQGPPNNCSLENSENPAFQLDGCTKALAGCDETLTEAKEQFDANEGCRMNEEYKNCMRENTTDCDVSFVDSINQNIQQADLYFIQRNYFCQERIANNLTECDAAFRNCNSIIQDIGRTVTKSQEVCKLVEQFDLCRTNMADSCTPKLGEFYNKNAKTSSERFTGVPFFCGLENGCEKLFDDCNETLSSSNLEPCGFLPIYRSCLSSISDICDVGQFSNLTARINQIQNDTIEEDPNNCMPTTTAIPSTSITTERPTGLAYCAGESTFCINQFNQDEYRANGTVSLICLAVDRALSCVANKTSTCDPISAASVANSMSGIIKGYQGPPNNCSLENSDNPAFQLDVCTKALAACDEKLTDAKTNFDVNEGCRINEVYKNCMRENTTDCDVSFVDSINQNIQQADLYFIQRNYFCQERIANNLTECDAAFRNCNSIIQDIGRSVTKSQQVCKLAEEFNLCRTNMTDSCTPQIGKFYNKNAETSSERFTGVPFFCGSDNGCQKVFDDCNNTLGARMVEPCGFLPIYRTCLSSISDICDVEQFSNLTTRINQIENDTIEQDSNDCIPTTTPPVTTTTEQPTGLAYCAGESMFCINQFNQDEYLANGTVSLICQAVDKALSCVANKTSTCDPISAATVANSMSGIIEGYQGPPNNCSLENSNNPAFKLDGCTKALADCDKKLTEAKTNIDVNEGCRINEVYKNCMRENTTDCDVTFVDSINQNIQQADLYFIQRNYFCQERNANNLTECDASFRNCNSIIQDIGRTVTKSQQVCKLAEKFDLCRTNMTDSCTPQIGKFYNKNGETSSERFTGVPFFCGSDNGCQKVFDDCNNTLGARMVEPCGFLPIYRTCLSSIYDICDVEQLFNLTTKINQIENDTIEQDPNNCIPSTTPPPTTTLPSTTTKRPTGLAYCARESMFCINQFNQDEVQANGTLSLICQAVDRALSCVANKTSTCDPISAASVANSMSGIIEGYQGPPNNCSLENSDNPAFQMDSCTTALANCDKKLIEAKTNIDVNEGCRINEVYKNCMRENTTDCDVSFVDSINQNIQQADLYFIQRNYFCQERIANNLTECDSAYRVCNYILKDIGRTVTKSQEVCRLAEEFNVCRTTMIDSCTPQIGQFYSNNAETSSERFTGVPFFCGSDNGCQKVFDDCNNTLGARMVEPCGFLPIHKVCLSSIADICDASQFTELRNKIDQIENDTIENDPYQCIPTTTFPTTTLDPNRKLNTTECNKAILPCYNEFQTSEFKANGDSTLICSAFDTNVKCITDIVERCDLLATAEVKRNLQLNTDYYNGPPHNCNVETNLKLDVCSEILAECSKIRDKSQMTNDPELACSLLEDYKSCMTINASICDVTYTTIIQDNIQSTEQFFIDGKYFCDERKDSDQSVCDSAYNNCYSKLSPVGVLVVESDLVCPLADEYVSCVEDMLGNCTQNIGDNYKDVAMNIRKNFDNAPYMCNEDNPCQAMFDFCNATDASQIQDPCDLPPVYETCFNNMAMICNRQQMNELSAQLEAESIRLKAKCEETTPTPLNIVTRNPKFQQRPIGRRPGFLPAYGVTPGHMEKPDAIIQGPAKRPINLRPYPNLGGYTPGVVQFPVETWSTADPGPTPKQADGGQTIKVPIQWPAITKNPPPTLPPKRHNSEPGYVQEAYKDSNGKLNPKPTEWTMYYGNSKIYV